MREIGERESHAHACVKRNARTSRIQRAWQPVPPCLTCYAAGKNRRGNENAHAMSGKPPETDREYGEVWFSLFRSLVALNTFGKVISMCTGVFVLRDAEVCGDLDAAARRAGVPPGGPTARRNRVPRAGSGHNRAALRGLTAAASSSSFFFFSSSIVGVGWFDGGACCTCLSVRMLR